MRRILVAVDGSECAQRALRYVVGRLKNQSERPDIHVLHVKLPLPEILPGIIEPEPFGRMWQEEADAATRSAHVLLAQAGLPHKVDVQIGDAAEEITQYAKVRVR